MNVIDEIYDVASVIIVFHALPSSLYETVKKQSHCFGSWGLDHRHHLPHGRVCRIKNNVGILYRNWINYRIGNLWKYLKGVEFYE